MQHVRSADAFADSVGVNVHLAYYPSNYRELDPAEGTNAQWSRVSAALADLGVRYVRDHVPHAPEVMGAFVALAKDIGVRASFIMPPPGHFPFEQTVDVLRALAQVGAVASIEGLNEPDNPPQGFDAGPLQDLQALMHKTFKDDPELAQIPLLAPPLITEDGHAALGDLTQHVDRGNVHPYAIATAYTAELLETYLGWARLVTGYLPVQATETGYCSPLTPADDFGAWCGVSARAAGAYLPKALLTNFAHGVERTYIYELLDEMLEGSPTGPSHDPGFASQLADPRYHQGRFGLLERDFTPKPAYKALRNLLSLTADPGSAFVPEELPVTVSDEQVHSLALQRRDGEHLLLLWHDVELYAPELDRDHRRVPYELYPPGRPVEVSWRGDREVLVHHVAASSLPVASLKGPGAHLVLPPDDVVVLRLQPSRP